ncbi:MAG: hypothetical protein JXQ29_12075 [Planctomycetes bacterium]|nr:hypothetical protein [Planctomycetota bacterium]
MQEAPQKRGWPNPLRTPLLLIAGLVAYSSYPNWVGGTGGLDLARFAADPDQYGSSVSMSLALGRVLPVLVLLVAGLAAGALFAGPARMLAGLRYALGSSDSKWMPGAARFLSASARAVAWGGVLLGCGACALIEIVPDPESPENLLPTAREWSLFAPFAGIVLGRIVLGGLAAGARIRSGEPAPPVFSRLQDFALLGLFAIPWYWYCLITWGW